jgi:hypothetical protein
MCTASQSGHNKVSSVYVAARSGMLRVDNEVSSFYGTQARGVGQLGDVSGDASRPVAGHQLGGRAGGPAPSQNRRVGAQKDAGFRKTRVESPCVVSALLLGVAPGVRPEPAQMCARNR